MVMSATYDVAAIGNAIVDIIAPASDDFLQQRGMAKGGWTPMSLEQITAHIDRNLPDTQFNFQFIIDSFAVQNKQPAKAGSTKAEFACRCS